MSLDLGPYDPTEVNPYSSFLDKMEQKVQERRVEFGASHLNAWADEADGGSTSGR